MIQQAWIGGLHAPENMSLTYLAVAILDDTEPLLRKRKTKQMELRSPNELLMQTYMIVPDFVKYMYEDLFSRSALGIPRLHRRNSS